MSRLKALAEDKGIAMPERVEVSVEDRARMRAEIRKRGLGADPTPLRIGLAGAMDPCHDEPFDPLTWTEPVQWTEQPGKPFRRGLRDGQTFVRHGDKARRLAFWHEQSRSHGDT